MKALKIKVRNISFTRTYALKLLVYEALTGLKLLVYDALSY